MATPTATPAAAAADAQAAQAGLVAVMARDVTAAWAGLDVADLRQSLPNFQLTVAAIVRRYSLAAGTLAARFYATQRHAAGITAPFTPRPASPPPIAQVAKTVDWATQPLWSAAPDVRTAETNVVASSERLVLDVGRQTITQNVDRDRHAKAWARVTEPGACAFCLMLATRGAVYKSDTADFRTHTNCVLPGTWVNGPSAELGYRRWYQGEVVIIGIADGQELSVTPNHPILTDVGWVPAGLLTQAHQVVQRSGTDLASLNVPHEKDVPSRIEKVWGAGLMRPFAAVPVAPQHFHGDGVGSQGKIEVVAANGLLSNVRDALFLEEDAKPIGPFARGAAIASSLTTESDSVGVLVRHGSSAHRRMSGRSQLEALRRCHLSHPNRIREGAITDWLLGFREPTPDRSPSHPVLVGDLFLGLTGAVEADYLGWRLDSIVRRPSGPGTRFDPPATEDETQRLRVHSDFGRALLERLSGGVKISRPLYLRRVDYSGHVYNLQTTEGWYEANSIVVSNCRCHAEPVFTQYEPSAQIRTAQAVYKQSTAGLSGAARLAAFRRAVAEHPDLSPRAAGQ